MSETVDEKGKNGDPRIPRIASSIRVVPDFPKPERVGAEVVECACVIEVPALKGREKLNGKQLFVLVESH